MKDLMKLFVVAALTVIFILSMCGKSKAQLYKTVRAGKFIEDTIIVHTIKVEYLTRDSLVGNSSGDDMYYWKTYKWFPVCDNKNRVLFIHFYTIQWRRKKIID